MPYFAHSAPDRADWEPLAHHLEEVARRAEAFAAPFGAGPEARLAGLLHDLGKYSERFTHRLEGTESGLDHWSIGALASGVVARTNALATAFAIHGHHVGLADPKILQTLQSKTGDRSSWTESDPKTALDRLRADGLVPPELPGSSTPRRCGPRERHLPADASRSGQRQRRERYKPGASPQVSELEKPQGLKARTIHRACPIGWAGLTALELPRPNRLPRAMP